MTLHAKRLYATRDGGATAYFESRTASLDKVPKPNGRSRPSLLLHSVTAAVLLLGGPSAFAQSNVTVFGVLDTSISYYEAKSSFYTNGVLPFAGTPQSPKQSKWAMSTGNFTGSRIGFRGTEDLGGGLTAGFWLESGIANDTGSGTSSGGITNFNRRSTLSLSSPLGELRLGRDYVPTYWNDVNFDPFGLSGVGQTLMGTIGINLANAKGPGSQLTTNDNYTRSSNSIGYHTPKGLGGFYGQLMYAPSENVRVSNVPGSPSKRGKYFGGRAGYASGPLDVAVAYGSSQAVDAVVNGVDQDEKLVQISVGGTYDFGPAKVFAEVAQFRDKLTLSGVKSNDRYLGGLFGVSVPVGVGLIRAAYSQVSFHGAAATPSGRANEAKAQKLALGYVHNLSKRTLLYASVAKVRVSNGQNNPAVMGALTGGGLAYASTGGGVQGFAPRSSTGYDFGIRHNF